MVGLKDYLEGDIKFSWQDNNCLGFVSGALEAQGLTPLKEDWYRGFWDTRSAIVHYRKTLLKYKEPNILSAFDNLFSRELTLHPRTGMIVARKTGDLLGYAFGVVYNGQAFFLDYSGVVCTNLEVSDLYWRVR